MSRDPVVRLQTLSRLETVVMETVANKVARGIFMFQVGGVRVGLQVTL